MAALEIVIAYPPAGDDEDVALSLARRLFAVLDVAIDSLTLAPAAGGDLTVHLNGRLVYARSQAGRPPRVADVTERLDRAG
jgi:predicted Rdx family selenoprotein